MKAREVKLDVRDRLNLLGILPGEGNYLTVKLVKELQEALSFNPSEHELLKFVELPNRLVTWDQKGAEVVSLKSIVLSEPTEAIVIETLKGLDSRKQLKEALISLYELFVLNKEKQETK